MQNRIVTRKNPDLKIEALWAFVLFFSLLLVGCGDDVIYEDYVNLPDNTWAADSIKSFQFDIQDKNQAYNLDFIIKNNLDYTHYNIFVDYKLFRIDDGTEELLEKGKKEFILFHPKTGEPFGSGSSGWYNHVFNLMKEQSFSQQGRYEIRLQQYMRIENLTEVAAIGFSLSPYKAKAE